MIDIALSGGCIIKRRFSVCTDRRFLDVVDVLRGADVTFGHLEGTIAEGDAAEVFPAAEAGWTWIRMPDYFAKELRWAGYDLLSHASNHCLDFMYGGLYETWKALKAEGLPHAGTGMSLAQSRAPAYIETAKARVALISSVSSAPDWARAADARGDNRGRPGANQLRRIQVLEPADYEALRALARKMGLWITDLDDEMMLNPSGLHNTITRFARAGADRPAGETADRADVEANLASIRIAKERADLVIFHIHNHEWDPQKELQDPPPFIRDLAREAIDAGADIFIAEGAHSLLRGIEIYRGKPIFYDPGDVFKDGNSKIRPLSEYYWTQGTSVATGRREITTIDSPAHRDHAKTPVATNPVGGYNTGRILAVVVPVCRFDDDGTLREIVIHPATHIKDSRLLWGLPGMAAGDEAEAIVGYLGELSAPFGTEIAFENGKGIIRC
jgi:poly-gamma-glutamate capsule biosynthesis protein CapA/YwtB (metallophosphatase superfamily)